MVSGGGISGNKVPSDRRVGQIQQFTPEQMKLFQQMLGSVGPDSYLSKLAGGDEGIFNQIEAPAMKQFSALQGNLASRFSGMGQGGRHSSGFQNTANTATQDFASQLQSQRQGLQQQAIKDLHGMSQNLLNQRPYEQFTYDKKKKNKSFFDQILGFISPAGGDVNEGGTNNIENFFKMLSSMGGG